MSERERTVEWSMGFSRECSKESSLVVFDFWSRQGIVSKTSTGPLDDWIGQKDKLEPKMDPSQSNRENESVRAHSSLNEQKSRTNTRVSGLSSSD